MATHNDMPELDSAKVFLTTRFSADNYLRPLHPLSRPAQSFRQGALQKRHRYGTVLKDRRINLVKNIAGRQA